MTGPGDNPFRKLGRWAGRIRAGFRAGLHGEPDHPADRGPAAQPPRSEGGAAGKTTEKRVIARRTTIEEIEIHDPERR